MSRKNVVLTGASQGIGPVSNMVQPIISKYNKNNHTTVQYTQYAGPLVSNM